jgi:holin-like protein
MASWIKAAGQVAFFIVFSWCINGLTELFRWNIPGSIVGIVILFGLLQTKIIKLEWIDLGAKWLIAETLLFFTPSAVGIVQYKDLIVNSGARILIVILGSILIVMAATGLLAERLSKPKETKTTS